MPIDLNLAAHCPLALSDFISMKLHLFLFPLLLFGASLRAQTVGTLLNEPESWDGYTLFSSTISTETYLINNCGEIINSWSSAYFPGLAVNLLDDGSLLRAGRISSNFAAGGSGGKLERYDWDGNLTWSWEYSTDDYHQHHDFEPLPNGNILVLAWELFSDAEAIAQGRDPSTLDEELWPDHVIEIEPIGSDAANIVWEWHAWDHLIQDFDPSRPNFGVVSDHPELFDLNYVNTSIGGIASQRDWMHSNGIDYNAELEQILISSRNFHEIWIIDHSTTTAEAASHSGGRWGKGGDILYRWGNPITYDRGLPGQQKFFEQHNAVWIPEGYPGAGNISVYNNGVSRPTGNWSSVDELIPPTDIDGNYIISDPNAYGPDFLEWTYPESADLDFYSRNISGAQRLPNGNTLICEGAKGNFFEIDGNGNTVWRYVNPEGVGGPVDQGGTPTGNTVFRAERYNADFEGFVGKDLTPGPRLEGGSAAFDCQTFPVGIEPEAFLDGFQVGPNPFKNSLTILNNSGLEFQFQVFGIQGNLLREGRSSENASVDLTDQANGMYLVRILQKDSNSFSIHKIIKTP
jgi:hypothetical protein